jgi:tRNA U55 pseudouridine synthase TruB
MSALEREKSGIFTLAQALKIEEIEKMSVEERENALLPTEEIFSSHPVFQLPSFFDRLVANGCRVNVKKLGLTGEEAGKRFRLYSGGVFFALGEIKKDGEELCLCKIKDFPPDEK